MARAKGERTVGGGRGGTRGKDEASGDEEAEKSIRKH